MKILYNKKPMKSIHISFYDMDDNLLKMDINRETKINFPKELTRFLPRELENVSIVEMEEKEEMVYMEFLGMGKKDKSVIFSFVMPKRNVMELKVYPYI